MAKDGIKFFPMGSGDSGDNQEGTGDNQDQAGNEEVQQPAAADKGKAIAVDDEGGSLSKGSKRLDEPAASSTNVRTGKKGKGKLGKVKGSVSVIISSHIFAERERRRRIKKLFEELHALMPHLSPKADKVTIVGEAVSFVRSLEESLAELEKRKREKDSLVARCALLALGSGASSSWAPAAADPPAPLEAPGGMRVWAGPRLVLNLFGDEQAFIGASLPRRPGVITMVLEVLDRHDIEVINMQISANESRSLVNFHTRLDREHGMFMETVTAQEIYLVALSEIMAWLGE
uniref:BHLH domain-containing protein n=1 Tax=Leersia perrieri TaxID=77586 RepID=A0A0D9VGV7_9ORYZ